MASQSSSIALSSGSTPIIYQLDECLSDPDLARECNKDGLVAVQKFPRRRRGIGTSDESVIAYCQKNDFPLLRADSKLPDNEAASLSKVNPGIIVVRSDLPGTMTTPIILSILGSFKNKLVDWHNLVLRNSIIELWPNGAYLRRAENSQLVNVEYLDFSEHGWQDSFLEIVRSSGSRSD